MDTLTVDHVAKNYESQPLLIDLSLEVHSGELVCLLGRSGSGKSTLLRIIAGIEPADSGRVLWNGEDLTSVPTHRRGFGLMFQDFALFPHLDVRQNVAFGLALQRLPESEIASRVDSALESVNMRGFARRRVTDLSGGEQQRVALARSLAPRPRLLMLDEPLGALDRALRGQLQEELREQLHRTGIPAIYVTHDQDEALALADRIALLHSGRIEQSGAPGEVYARPASQWVAEFLGMSNLLPGEVIGTAPLTVRTGYGIFKPETAPEPRAGERGRLLLKPYGADLIPAAQDADTLSGKVISSTFQIDHYLVKLELAPGLVFDFTMREQAKEGETIHLKLSPESQIWFKEAQ